MSKLVIAYKNGTSDEFTEAQLDCSVKTLRGHASNITSALSTGQVETYCIDSYNAIRLSEVISVRITN